METQLNKAFTWEIDNIYENIDDYGDMVSDPFSSGGCEWCIVTHKSDDSLSVFLAAWDPDSLSLGWKRKATHYFVVLNQSGKELCTGKTGCSVFCAECSCWGSKDLLPLNILQEEWFMENNKLTIQVYMNVVEVLHQGKSTEHDTLVYKGFELVASQVPAVAQIFWDHPDIINEEEFRPKYQLEKTACMNVLLVLIQTLNKPPESLLEIELSHAHSKLTFLTEEGFKLDWLVTKLEDVSLQRKKTKIDVLKIEERIKYVELTLSDLKDEMDEEKIKSADKKVYSFEFIDFFIKRFFLSCFSISKH